MAASLPLLLALVAALAASLATPSHAAVAAAHADWYHKEHVRFHFFSKDTAYLRKGYQILKDLDKDDILGTGYNPALPTKILIHGFSNMVTSDSMQLPKNAYFAAGDGAVNVIVVDWSDLDPAPLYLAGIGNVAGVAERVAELVDFMVAEGLLRLDNLHIIGHSLGAHVAGVTGEKVTSGRIARITGLDPAKPGINLTKTKGRLSADDADLVDVIHTNAGKLALERAIGHVDFYPNGGKTQPGCNFDFLGTCSHGRSYSLWSESIANPDAFQANQCEDEWSILHQRCEPSDVIATMGEHVSFSQPGTYYLQTSDKSPFAL